MMRKSGIAAVAGLIALTVGCQAFTDEPELDDEELGRVETMLAENFDLSVQLFEAQRRLVLDCLEARGYTAHDQIQLVMWSYELMANQTPDETSVPWLWLGRDVNSEWGFGVWTSTLNMEGSEEHLEFLELTETEGYEDFATVDNSEFEKLPLEDRLDWYVAYYGEERAAADNGFETYDSEAIESDDTGGLLGTIEPRGCRGEIADALGIEAEFVPVPEFGEDAGTWTTIPRPPGSETIANGELDHQLIEERTGDQEYLDCLEDAGWGRWEFNLRGSLGVWQYASNAYDFITIEGYDEGIPDPPSDVPTGPQERRAWEVGLADDMWDCVDRTGIDQEHHRAWKAVYGAYFLDLESEIYAWQEDMRELIDRAQELLTG